MSDILEHRLPKTCIKGYRLIKRLDRGRLIATYQAIKLETESSIEISSSETVRIEILRSPNSQLGELASLYNHYVVAKNLTVPGIVKPLEFQVGKFGCALVLEDLGIGLKD